MIEKFNLKLDDLLKNGEEEASLLVRMMLSCNDIQLANRCMGYFKATTEESNKHLKVGACRYFFKIQCAHFSEARKLIDLLDSLKNKPEYMKILDTYNVCSEESKKYFEDLLSCGTGRDNHEKFKTKVVNFRHWTAFHYSNSEFKNAIKRRAENPKGNNVNLSLGNNILLNRYHLADDVLDTLVCRQVWNINVDVDEIQKEADSVAEYASDLCKKYLIFSTEFLDIYLKKYVKSYHRLAEVNTNVH